MSELPRRLVHLSGSAAPLTYLLGVLSWRQVAATLAAICVVVGVLEFLRLRGYIDWWIYRALTRDYEKDGIASYVVYAAGMGLTAVAFPPAVAVPALLMLTVGDPVSGYLSEADLGEKEWWVMGVMFAVCLGIALALAVPPAVAVAGAAVATAADARTPVVHGYVVDDNVTIPVGAALTMWLATAVVQFA